MWILWSCHAIIVTLFRCKLPELHPPHCLGAMSDLQLSMTGSYQGFGAGLCRVIESIGCIVFIPAQRISKGPRLGYYNSHRHRWIESHSGHKHTCMYTHANSWHLMLGSLGRNENIVSEYVDSKLTVVGFATLRDIKTAIKSFTTHCNSESYLFKQLPLFLN